MIKQANYLGVVVDNLEEASAFYRDVLGMEIDQQESIPDFYTQFKLSGGAVLSLQASTDIPGGAPYEPAVLVDDVDDTYGTWLARGVEMLDEPRDLPFGRAFLFRTPQGHVFRAFKPHPNGG